MIDHPALVDSTLQWSWLTSLAIEDPLPSRVACIDGPLRSRFLSWDIHDWTACPVKHSVESGRDVKRRAPTTIPVWTIVNSSKGVVQYWGSPLIRDPPVRLYSYYYGVRVRWTESFSVRSTVVFQCPLSSGAIIAPLGVGGGFSAEGNCCSWEFHAARMA